MHKRAAVVNVIWFESGEIPVNGTKISLVNTL